jgi:hypothetical protein
MIDVKVGLIAILFLMLLLWLLVVPPASTLGNVLAGLIMLNLSWCLVSVWARASEKRR